MPADGRPGFVVPTGAVVDSAVVIGAVLPTVVTVAAVEAVVSAVAVAVVTAKGGAVVTAITYLFYLKIWINGYCN